MKRIVMGIAAAVLISAATPAYAAQTSGQDNIIDQAGDWFATIGKSGLDKEAILTQRRAQRTARRAGEAAKRQAREAEKGINNAGKDLNKGLKSLSN